VIVLKGIRKCYHNGDERIQAANIPELELKAGRFYALMGPSGAGKSTILYIISGLEAPDEGSVYVNKENITGMPQGRLADFRFRNMGIVFQKDNLIEELKVYENLLLFLEYSGGGDKGRALRALEAVGVAKYKGQFPRNLSAGERQRVAIARALLFNPGIILADEPTANLDSENGRSIFRSLKELSSKGKLVITATHDSMIRSFADEELPIRDGAIGVKP